MSDTSEHTLMVCPRWVILQEALFEELGLDSRATITVELIMNRVLMDRERWLSFRHFCRQVIITKQKFERLFERGEGDADDPLDGVALRNLFGMGVGVDPPSADSDVSEP